MLAVTEQLLMVHAAAGPRDLCGTGAKYLLAQPDTFFHLGMFAAHYGAAWAAWAPPYTTVVRFGTIISSIESSCSARRAVRIPGIVNRPGIR
jgi:hypothetical protein